MEPARRPWLPAAVEAVLVVALAQLWPLFGPLEGHEHCIESYLRLFAVLPGLLAGFVLAGGQGLGLFVVAGLVTLGAMALLTAALRHPSRARWWIAALAAAVAAGNAGLVAAMLRA